ncbi:MAG: hypothetical protein KAG61_12800 [Bacteriovoracaceae bacterium]|nr:hypothetical protein [Bacteriovoracaceae bacterium]
MNKLQKLEEGMTERKDKSLRTLRNNLNNRISAHERSEHYGRALRELKESHPLYGLSLKDCKDLLDKALREIKKRIKG